VVEIGSDVIVFDHGFGAHHRLLEIGIPATRVSHLLFTFFGEDGLEISVAQPSWAKLM
jgi:hypothetical protein